MNKAEMKKRKVEVIHGVTFLVTEEGEYLATIKLETGEVDEE